MSLTGLFPKDFLKPRWLLRFASIWGLFMVVSGSVALAETPAEAIAEVQQQANTMWVLVAAALVFLMQAGFMCLEAGISEAKHSINVAIKNMTDFVIAVCGFWLVGFGLMFGLTESGWFGTSDFMISIQKPWDSAFFVFQAVFVGTAATITSGAIAGRTRFSAYVILSLIVSILVYPVAGHWSWGGGLHGEQGGWLANMGFIDFAGSTVVHSVGGWVALAALIVVGPRLGRFSPDGKPQKFQPHNTILAYLGTFILFFGWFGFNGGSTLTATEDVAPIIMNTVLAACFGAMAAGALSWIFSPLQLPEGEMISNGLLGGLVGITAGCAAVDAGGAAAIGVISGIIIYFGTLFMERVLKLDDVVGAVPVHGFCGAWGTIAVGIFITSDNLGDMSRLELIGVQAIGVVASFIWAFCLTYLIMRVINIFIPFRVPPEDERIGLNVSEHGSKMAWLNTLQTMGEIIRDGDFSHRVEVEPQTEAGEVAACFNSLLRELETVADVVDVIAQGNLNVELKPKGERDKLGKALNGVFASLRDVIVQVKDVAKSIDVSVGDLANTSSSLMGDVMEVTTEISNAAEKMNAETQTSQNVVANTVDGMEFLKSKFSNNMEIMDQLRESLGSVHQIITGIKGISKQTNMLSLNAAIEAAKAGEKGRGFSIVAEEIRNLAHRSADASQQIAELIHDIERNSSRFQDVSKEVNDALAEAIGNVEHTSVSFDRVKERISQVYQAISKLTSTTDTQSTATAERVTQIAQELVDKAQVLVLMITFFKFDEKIHAKMSPAQ